MPPERFADTYTGQPLSYVARAAQKNHLALYLMGVYGDAAREAWLREEFRKAGKQLDMGQSCLRFRRLEDLPLDVVGQMVARLTPEQYVARYEACRQKAK